MRAGNSRKRVTVRVAGFDETTEVVLNTNQAGKHLLVDLAEAVNQRFSDGLSSLSMQVDDPDGPLVWTPTRGENVVSS